MKRNMGSEDLNQNILESTKAKDRLKSFLNWQPKKDYLILQYMRESTVHGIKYIAQPRHIVERIFWAIVLLTSTSIALNLSYGIIEKYNESSMIVSFQPQQTSIANVVYPAVTVCNVNRFRRSYFEKALRILEQRESKEVIDATLIFLRQLNHICMASTSFSTYFNYSINETSVNLCGRGLGFDCTNLTSYDASPGKGLETEFNQEVMEMLQKAVPPCHEMILLCLWEGEIQNCSEIFEQVLTDMGLCCTFNMMPLNYLLKDPTLEESSERPISKDERKAWEEFKIVENVPDDDDSKRKTRSYLKRQSKAGVGSGLSILLNPEVNEYFCANDDGYGFRIFTHSPVEYPAVSNFGMAAPINVEMYMSMQPEITLAEKDVKGVRQSKRSCYYSNEHPLKAFNFYTATNCIFECIAHHIEKECNCTRFDFPQLSQRDIRYCEGPDYRCSKAVKRKIDKEGTSEHCDHCLHSCNRIEYRTVTSNLQMRDDINIWELSNETTASWEGKNVTLVHIFFGSDTVYSTVRKLLYTFNDVFAHVGGILGVFLGCSVLSLVEPINYLFEICIERLSADKSMTEDSGDNVVKISFKSSKINTIRTITND